MWTKDPDPDPGDPKRPDPDPDPQHLWEEYGTGKFIYNSKICIRKKFGGGRVANAFCKECLVCLVKIPAGHSSR